MKKVYYTVALDEKYLNETVAVMARSFKKFHDEDLLVLGPKDLLQMSPSVPYDWSFRLSPLTLNTLMEEYDCAIRLDADQVIMGNLDHTTEGDFDVAVVQNSSPRDYKNHYLMTGQKLSLYDIDPLDYVNCGFVVCKSKRFAKHWFRLVNSPFFNNYQFREQDMLNLLVHYFNYKVKFLDRTDDHKWHGVVAKRYTNHAVMREGKVIIPKNDEWPTDHDKELVCYHYAGGGESGEGEVPPVIQ